MTVCVLRLVIVELRGIFKNLSRTFCASAFRVFIYFYAMGSDLGPIISNSYMSALENKVFNTINKPNIYLRYADDILLLANSTDKINTIQETFQNNCPQFHTRNQYQQ